MKTSLAFIALMFLTTAFAEEPTAPASAPTPTVQLAPTTEPVKTDTKRSAQRARGMSLSSFENREKLKYQITASVIGHEYVATSPVTISLGYYIDPDNILIARYSNYNGSRSGLFSNDDVSESLRAVTLGVRHFFANSFNIMPTAYYRRNTKEGDYSLFTSQRSTLVYEDVGVGVRIGNEWQWENFTLGCDWFGVNRTLHAIHDEKTGVNDWDDFDSDRKLTFTIASFYLGFSF